MKRCSKCDVKLDNGNCFNEAEKICKDCKNARKSKLRRSKQQLLIEEAGGECISCGKEATYDTMVCFDFHHQGGKEERIAKMLADGRPLEVIRKEASKCVLFCACCHRLHHQKHGYK